MSPTREECLTELADFLVEKAYEMVRDGRWVVEDITSPTEDRVHDTVQTSTGTTF